MEWEEYGVPPGVRRSYEELRRKLIQTNLRNRMINYKKPSDRTSTGLDFTRGTSEHAWKTLVVDRKKLGFTGPPDPPQPKADPEEVLTPSPKLPSTTEDQLLYSELPKSKREVRLLGTYRAAIEHKEERGVNTLFLALGMLKWKDPSESESHLAPLILVPVNLERSLKGGYRISYDEGEIGTNLSLQVRLADQGIKFPEVSLEGDQNLPQSYFDEVAAVAEGVKGFAVLPNEIALSFFSFDKSPLYLDLDLAKWPEGKTPLGNEDILAALGQGYGPLDSPLRETTHIDDIRSPEDACEVFQADSSQLLVLEEAKRGTSMVVEGPPGTGKSQTIANIIAEKVSQGKTVLFVSEKMAALEVVYRKLKEAGLQDCALELHGKKANRRKIYEAVRSTWQLRCDLPDATAQLERLSEVRGQLNRYVRELNEPLEPWGASPRRIMGLYSTLPLPDADDLASGYDPAPLQDASWTEMATYRVRMREMQERLSVMGVPHQHPFWDSQIDWIGPTEKLALREKIERLESLARLVAEHAENLRATLGLAEARSLADTEVLARCVNLASGAPQGGNRPVKLGGWSDKESSILAVVRALSSRKSILARLGSQTTALAWTQDWSTARVAILQHGGSLWRILNRDWKEAVTAVKGALKTPRKLSPNEVRALVGDLYQAQEDRLVLENAVPWIVDLYPAGWQGFDTEAVLLERVLSWALTAEKMVKDEELPPAALKRLSKEWDANELAEKNKAVNDVGEQLRLAMLDACNLLRVSSDSLVGKPFAVVESKAKLWRENLDRVEEIIRWRLLARELREVGLAATVDLAERWTLAPFRLEHHIVRAWLDGLLKRGLPQRRSLQGFDPRVHDNLIREFCRLDEEVLQHNRCRARYAHLKRIPQLGQVGASKLLWSQCELKKGHKSVRWAMEEFHELILCIKPVFMMSPLSVASTLPRLQGLFDVVIFDEASQVRPEDSLSAISRAKQTIVVGDTKQMPPTSFFDALAQEEESADEEMDAAVGKMESVLALWSAAVQTSDRRRHLRWHYRSLHHSLIQTSNRLFYEDRLVVFPSPDYFADRPGSELGLRFNYDPKAIYDRGASRKINRQQAEQVAAKVVEHFRTRPHESLLVVAFSKDQQTAIQDALEVLAVPGLEDEYNQLNPHEPFKVKNLETVQGDERDVVFISVGYGPDETGAIMMNFGPLNKEGGERRLNVLITRAKKRTEVFTSIRSSDIKASDSKDSGLKALKVFLEFAERKILEEKRASAGEEESEFEAQVRRELAALGYVVDLQVGTAGFRIDLAVCHPQRPGEYVLGIECDGASYHSSQSARDRDKLRQIILESRGWRIHRIWSTDWWINREACIRRCKEAIEEAISLSNARTAEAQELGRQLSAPPGTEEARMQVWADGEGPRRQVEEPYKKWEGQIQLPRWSLKTLPAAFMAKWVVAVVQCEGPIHLDNLTARVRSSVGLERAGGLIKGAIERGVDEAQAQKLVEVRGAFLWDVAGKPLRARTRAGLPQAERNVDKLPPEEVDVAILDVVAHAFSVADTEVAAGVRVVFGYGAKPKGLPDLIRERVQVLLEEGRLVREGGLLKVPRD